MRYFNVSLTHVFQSGVSLLVEQPQHRGPGVAATDDTLQTDPSSLHQVPLAGGDLHQGRQHPDIQDEAGGGGGRDVVVGGHAGELGGLVGPGHCRHCQHVHCPLTAPGEEQQLELHDIQT